MTDRRCVSAGQCVDRERWGSRYLGALINAAGGMCPQCTARLERSIRSLASDVYTLNDLIAAAGSPGDARVSGSRDLMVPIRLGIEALRSEIDFETQYWAESVGMTPLAGHRLDNRVVSATEYLLPRVDKLLQLGEQERWAWTRDGEPCWDWAGHREVSVLGGLQGARILVDLHYRVRRVAGRTRLVHRLTPACPWCGIRALVRHNGSDVVECEGCGKEIGPAHYDWFVKTLVEQESAA